MFLCFLSFGQRDSTVVSFEIGPEFKTDVLAVPHFLVGSDESGFYVVFAGGAQGKGRKYLYKFDHNLKLVAGLEQALDLDLIEKRKIDYYIFQAGKKLFYISFPPGLASPAVFYIQEVNPVTLELSERKVVPTGRINDTQLQVNHAFLTSTHLEERIAMVHSFNVEIDALPAFAVNVFDRQMKLLWSGLFKVPGINRLVEVHDYQVDKRGVVHVLVKRYYKNIREVRNKEINYDYQLFSFHSDGRVELSKIDTEGNLMANMRLFIAENGDIICAGNYSLGYAEGLGGIFHRRWDGESMKVIDSRFEPLNKEFFFLHLSERQLKRAREDLKAGKQLEYNAFYLKQFIARPDGGWTMFGGLYSPEDLLSAKFPDKVITVYWEEYGILDINVSAEGTITHADIRYVGDFDFSHGKMVRPTEVIFFDGYNKKLDESSFSGRFFWPAKISDHIIIRGTRLGVNGEVEGGVELFNWAESKSKINLAFSFQLNEDEMIFLGAGKKRNQRFIKVKFKK